LRALKDFRDGRTRVLVATDIAARGIDVDGVSHVVNFELPEVPEAYVHRIGRTARAGATGRAISLCDNAERPLLRAIEKLTRQTIDGTDRRTPGGRHEDPEQEVRRPRPQQHHRPQGAGAGAPRAAQHAQGRPQAATAPRGTGQPTRRPNSGATRRPA
jgi:ATP-dependent RNA helicase RhlE